jgi:hypothetical protein
MSAPVGEDGAAFQILHHHIQPILRRVINHLGNAHRKEAHKRERI